MNNNILQAYSMYFVDHATNIIYINKINKKEKENLKEKEDILQANVLSFYFILLGGARK